MGGDDKTEKTTIMVLKVDLQCPCCYKKAKKVLCKVPQVRNQVYDEKTNTVTITVVCCSPEKIRDKLCYKGGKAIKSIEIKQHTKPTEPEKATKPPEKPEKQGKKVTFEEPEVPGKPKDKVQDAGKPKDKAKDSEKPTVIDKPKPKELEKPKEGTKAAMVATPWVPESMVMIPVQGFPQPPVGCSCGLCYHTGGPCYQYYGTPIPLAPYYGNYSYGYGPGPGPGPSGYGKGCCVNSDYFSEENASGCAIM